jgi:AcrR family transcriptional regulator
MYKQCTTEKAAIQQRQIEACLLAEMQKRDYHDITVSSLCEKAELSRKTFYRLFGNKDDVLFALVDHTMMDYARFQLPPEQQLAGAPAELQRFFVYWRENRCILDVLTDSHQASLLLERAIYHVLREEHGALRWLGADQRSTRMETTVFYISGIMGLLLNWYYSGFARSPVEMANIMMHLMSISPIQDPDSLNLI